MSQFNPLSFLQLFDPNSQYNKSTGCAVRTLAVVRALQEGSNKVSPSRTAPRPQIAQTPPTRTKRNVEFSQTNGLDSRRRRIVRPKTRT